MLKGFAAVTLLLLSTTGLAQAQGQGQGRRGGGDAEQPAWDVNNPPGQRTREVRIDVTEGTWMNVDVSPDGRTIAFDLLGDIYTLPIEGGTARRISSGLAFEHQPRFSPDGSRIAYTSDRGGGDNIWVMSPDGTGARAVTNETFTLMNAPTWSPDGRFIAARKHFTTQRSLGTGEIWLYDANGSGGGQALVERPNPQHQKELGEPAFSHDGRAIYFSLNTTPGPIFEYAQDSNQQVFAIQRYDMATGERVQVAGGPGGAVRPTPSPDGRHLAFIRREQGRSRLFVKDLETGAERRIYDDMDLDLQETWAVHGVYPNMDWTPDSRSIVFWAGGRIRRINFDGSGLADIPFRVSDTRAVIDPPRPEVDVAPAAVTTRMIRFPAVSPDGRQVVFESLGRLYIRDIQGGAPRQLTAPDGDFQLWPTWSRDGSRIAFVSWNDQRLGEIRVVDASGANVRAVTSVPGHYRRPRFSPSGDRIVFERDGGGFLTSDLYSGETGLYQVGVGGSGRPQRITGSGSLPHFGAEEDRIYFTAVEGQRRRLVSTDLDGGNRRNHAEGDLVTGFEVSPDGRALAFRENYNLFVTPFFNGAAMMNLSSRSGPLPVTRASRAGGEFGHWGGNGRSLNWMVGPTLYSADAPAMLNRAAGSSFAAPETGVSLAMSVPADAPQGITAIVGARIVTMNGEDGGVIEDGVVIVEGNRIRAVGPRASTPVPPGARTLDAAGRTILPGYIDGHGHGPYGVDDLVPQQNWSILAHLALGVTTIHDPSSSASEVFAAAEMQRAGIIQGPRLFSTAEIVYGARSPAVYAQIDSYQDALAHVRRLEAQGAHSVKNYNQPRRNQRQQVAAAARAENIAVVAEGGSLFTMDMTLIADGNTVLEHNIPQARLYEDVLSFFSQTRVAYNPTLVVTYGGLAGDPYWAQAEPVWRHPLLTRHVPPSQLANRVRVTTAPPEQFVDQYSARESDRLDERGVLVATGGHGQQEGLATHWEIWSHARGGATPLEALQHATVDAARAYGFRDIGVIRPGNLADLVILTANPLEDIRNSDDIAQVMVNGRLYDAATLNETVTGDRRRLPYFWEQGGGNGGGGAGEAAGHQDGDAG
jgi:imidazolonepropionase-like amidohydrolase/Tol biopolymer transport system component